MASGPQDGMGSPFADLYASARKARSRAQQAAGRTEVVLEEASAVWQQYQQARARSERARELSQDQRRARMPYSAAARLQARLASLPAIEQAKGIIMVQLGCTDDEAFDALRRASQRSNVRVRDLAARIVANTASDQKRQTASPEAQAQAAEWIAIVSAAARTGSGTKAG